ncbi:MAG: hypothetical protein CVV00_10025 [Firmicutes bacterium HGW-Firmicutes-5]|nr:MAG: hypothetical protein CVV00_10025 [Firmicutes bacterium HGW-Firmicutes-5]
MPKKKKHNGHYCKICGTTKANEKFSGKGHRNHICKACSGLPVEKRNEMIQMRKIEHIDMNIFSLSIKEKDILTKYVKDKKYSESIKSYAQSVLDQDAKVKKIIEDDYDFDEDFEEVILTEMFDDEEFDEDEDLPF